MSVAKFLLRQRALLEKFVQERVVRFRDEFDQFPMQLGDALFPFARRRFFAKLPAPIGFIGHDFVAQDVEHLVEVRSGIDRHVQRKNFRSVVRACLGQHFVEVRVLFVHGVDHEDLWDAAVCRAIPDPLRAHADAFLRVHHHESEIRHVQGRERLAHEVEITRAYRGCSAFCPSTCRAAPTSGWKSGAAFR